MMPARQDVRRDENGLSADSVREDTGRLRENQKGNDPEHQRLTKNRRRSGCTCDLMDIQRQSDCCDSASRKRDHLCAEELGKFALRIKPLMTVSRTRPYRNQAAGTTTIFSAVEDSSPQRITSAMGA